MTITADDLMLYRKRIFEEAMRELHRQPDMARDQLDLALLVWDEIGPPDLSVSEYDIVYETVGRAISNWHEGYRIAGNR